MTNRVIGETFDNVNRGVDIRWRYFHELYINERHSNHLFIKYYATSDKVKIVWYSKLFNEKYLEVTDKTPIFVSY